MSHALNLPTGAGAVLPTISSSSLPIEMQNLRNWACHDEKHVPKQTDGRNASHSDPRTWTDYETAKKYEHQFSGISFAVGDGIVGIDLDKVIKNSVIDPWAQTWIMKFQSYTEPSPSGEGIRIFVKSGWTRTDVKQKIGGKEKFGFGAEVYSRQKFLTVTERPIHWTELREVPAAQIDEMLKSAQQYFEAKCRDRGQAHATDPSPSGEDWKLIGKVAREVGLDPDKIEAELQRRHAERYEERNATKGDRGKLSYFRDSIEKYVKSEGSNGSNGYGSANGYGSGSAIASIAAPTYDVVETEDEPLSEYPEPKNDLISETARGLQYGTQLPLGHLRESVKAIVASYIGDGNIIYPVMPNARTFGWHFNLGGPQCMKTESFRAAISLGPVGMIEIPKNDFGVGVHKLTRYGSAAFLVKGFESQPRQLLYVTEGNVLRTANEHFPAVFSKLIDAYDDREMSSGSYKNGEHTVQNVEASAIICQTEADFLSTFGGQSAVGSGGIQRFTITHSTPVEKQDWAQDQELIRQHRERLMERVRNIIACKIVVTETPEAKAIRLATFTELSKLDPHFAARLDDIYRKEILLAAAFAPTVEGGFPANPPEFMEDIPQMKTVVTAEMSEFARKFVMYQYELRQALWPTDAASPTEKMEIAMKRHLSNHCLQPDRSLMKAAHVERAGSGGVETYKRAKKALRDQSMKCVGVNRSGRALYCSADCEAHAAISWRWS